MESVKWLCWICGCLVHDHILIMDANNVLYIASKSILQVYRLKKMMLYTNTLETRAPYMSITSPQKLFVRSVRSRSVFFFFIWSKVPILRYICYNLLAQTKYRRPISFGKDSVLFIHWIEQWIQTVNMQLLEEKFLETCLVVIKSLSQFLVCSETTLSLLRLYFAVL